MLEPFEKNIRRVWIRCNINLLLRHAGRVLTIAGAAAVMTVLAERLLALSLIRYNTVLRRWPWQNRTILSPVRPGSRPAGRPGE
jgi:hypothetical protein